MAVEVVVVFFGEGSGLNRTTSNPSGVQWQSGKD